MQTIVEPLEKDTGLIEEKHMTVNQIPLPQKQLCLKMPAPYSTFFFQQFLFTQVNLYTVYFC